jgi:uncharacterized protein (DUF362 family)
MAKGISVKLKTYSDTVPKLLNLIKLNDELKKHNKIVLKVNLSSEPGKSTRAEFVEPVLRYCLSNKNADSQIFIAEGADGADTMELFNEFGYNKLAEAYSVGLVDLNDSAVQEIQDGEFLKFQRIMYPEILLDSFIISLPMLGEDAETGITGSLSAMLGAFPSNYYKGMFSAKKTKIRKEPIRYAIHDILKCKMPALAVIDASNKGMILAGQPLEMDKQAAKLLGKEILRDVPYLRLIEDSFKPKDDKGKSIEIVG